MQILGLLGMYFDAVVVFVTNFSLLFGFNLVILCFSKICEFVTNTTTALKYKLQLILLSKSFCTLFTLHNIKGKDVWAFG